MKRQPSVTFRLSIKNQDPQISNAEVGRLVQRAISQALEDVGPSLKVYAETEGGFAGLGETTFILSVTHAVEHVIKAGTAAFALGALTAAGKAFYENALAPRLRKLNLLPSHFQLIAKEQKAAAKKKSRALMKTSKTKSKSRKQRG